MGHGVSKKYYGVVGHKHLRRDPDSLGIINVDNEALNKYKHERDIKLKMAKVVEEHEVMRQDIETVKSQLSLIIELLGKK